MSDSPIQPEDTSAATPLPGEPPAAEHPVGDNPSVEQVASVQVASAQVPSEPSGGDQPSAAIRAGTIRYGNVIEVTPEDVVLNMGEQVIGRVPFLEFAGHPTPKVGDEVSVIVEQYDPNTKEVALSKRHADEVLFWQTVKPGDILEGVVTGMNKGGLDVDIGGARAFLPSSQVDLHRMKDISVLIGEHVSCVVSQVDRTTKDLVLSRRKLQEKERKQQRQSAIDALVEGELRSGKVTNVTEYGAFVDMDGVAGLVHLTDLSWGRIPKPAEVVHVGQEVKVRILKVDRAKGKVSLGIKQATPDPWETVVERYPVGSRIKTKVARLADFGAFIELETGVDALLPLSEMSWSRRVGRPEDIVQIGQEIEVQILRVEPDKHRVSVGLKQLQEDPWNTIESRFTANGKFAGRVVRTTDFGAFVELVPGIEGLVHISELSLHRVNAVTDVVKEGQEIEVRVLKVDKEAQRISLSMKPPPPQRHAAAQAAAPAKPDKKRKRPLRGGLSSHFEW
ncbi:MAG TPA: S1 RNA-binding domain-containing protein [Phycisphaerae bacterium]|nr:S1 RNA-binding domain-containing protein [Phycisphaerae bacterium]